MTAALVLAMAACGGSGAPTGTAATAPTGTAAPAGSAPAGSAPASTAGSAEGSQFGGDICSAVTEAEVIAASYPQGTATFDTTDTQKDADTGQPVVCQYLVTFGDAPSIVGIVVSLMNADEYGTRTEVSLIAPPEALTGIGSEAFLVQPAPGLFEVWVSGANGFFKLGAQSKETAIALATIAAGRD
ncbi:MAG: hypothetical protein ACYC65_10430 [Candidatus Limnocylindrales bacterium]